ncbi:MAG TPA: hypothetical protein VJU16_02350, partial [Planctomycetota bacterium]|nr:hypothetical protein [Planctomycetota bacterium]
GQANFGYRDPVLGILARRGDAKAQEWLLEQLARRGAHDDDQEDPAVELIDDPAFRHRVLAIARAQCLPGRAGGRALAILADRNVIEARPLFLLGALKESVPCLRAMFRLKDPEAFGLAIKLLGSGGVYARLGAIRALEEWGGRPAVPYLVSRLDDMEEAWDAQIERGEDRMPNAPNPRIAVAAMAALEKLTGVKSEGTSHAERRVSWKDWHAKNRDAWK